MGAANIDGPEEEEEEEEENPTGGLHVRVMVTFFFANLVFRKILWAQQPSNDSAQELSWLFTAILFQSH